MLADMSGTYDVIVVGAGLAGLTAARILTQSGLEVLLLEAAPVVGGRVRSRHQGGVILDAGYQVLFPAYPTVQRHLDLRRLELVRLTPAANIRQGKHSEIIGNPLRDPVSLWSVGGNSLGEAATELSLLLQERESAISNSDKSRLLQILGRVKSQPAHILLRGDDETTLSYLQRKGISQRAIDLFFRPFLGGIFLNRELSTSARLFRYYLRMLADGGAALPRMGMGEIARQLAEGLDFRTNIAVTHLQPTNNHVVVKSTSETWQAKNVIVATDPASAQQLTGEQLDNGSLSSSYLHYWTPQHIDSESRLLLNGQTGLINNAHWISNAVPDRTPAGGHLLTVTVLGQPISDNAQLDAAIRRELSTWYDPTAVATLKTLLVERINHAQYPQPPHYHRHLTGHATQLSGVFVASERTSMSGIQGAMESGEKAAAILLNDMLGLSRPRGA